MSKMKMQSAGAPCGSAGGDESCRGGVAGEGWPRVVVVIVIVLAVTCLAVWRVPLPMPLVWLAAAAAVTDGLRPRESVLPRSLGVLGGV